jgi:hypothetical protein
VEDQSDTKPLTPFNIDYAPEDYIGASNVAPVVTASAILYAQDRGGRVREMKFVWQQQGYRSADISIMAPHLFDTYTLSSMTYTRAPYSIVWVTRSDGTLLGLTYVQEHEVAAWHHHDTQGTFECACAHARGRGRRALRHHEPHAQRPHGAKRGAQAHALLFTSLECVLRRLRADLQRRTRDGDLGPVAPRRHDGEHPRRRRGGAAAGCGERLDHARNAASIVNIGLPFVADFETLPLRSKAIMAAAQGMMKNLNAVWLRLISSSGVFAGPSTSKLDRDQAAHYRTVRLAARVDERRVQARALAEVGEDTTLCCAAIESGAGDGSLARARTSGRGLM